METPSSLMEEKKRSEERGGGEREREMGMKSLLIPFTMTAGPPQNVVSFIYIKKKTSAKTHIYLSEMKYGLKLCVPSVQLYLDIVLIC